MIDDDIDDKNVHNDFDDDDDDENIFQHLGRISLFKLILSTANLEKVENYFRQEVIRYDL